MSCCDGNLTECPGEETEYQDSAHSQMVLLSLIISLWIFSIVQFLRSHSSPDQPDQVTQYSLLQRIFRVALAGALL